jgi:cell division protein FtsQ
MIDRRRSGRGRDRPGPDEPRNGAGGAPDRDREPGPDDLTDLVDLTVGADSADTGLDDNESDDDGGDPSDSEEGGPGSRRRRSRTRTSARSRGVSGLRLLLLTVATIVVVIGLFLVAYFSPLMSVRAIEVSGNSVVTSPEIVSAAALSKGEPLMQVDTASAARRVSMIPRVATVRVKREYPSTITISVVERKPVVFTERDGKRYLMDKLGFEFAQQDPPPGLAQLVTPGPGSADPSTRAALTVMTDVPPYVADQVARIEVTSPVNIVLQLKDKRTVVWGDDERNGEKAETLRHVLEQEGTEYNVSSPQNPTFK